jgi:hypothetical protein
MTVFDTIETKEVNVGGLLTIPRLTTTQRNALTAVAGMLIYNTTSNKLNFYTGSGWEAVTSA